MVRVTADTNILISGLLFRGANPNTLLEMARSGAVQLVISDAILDEMADVLGRKFDWPPERVAEARHQIEQFAQKVEPSETLDAVVADPADTRFWNALWRARLTISSAETSTCYYWKTFAECRL